MTAALAKRHKERKQSKEKEWQGMGCCVSHTVEGTPEQTPRVTKGVRSAEVQGKEFQAEEQ